MTDREKIRAARKAAHANAWHADVLSEWMSRENAEYLALVGNETPALLDENARLRAALACVAEDAEAAGCSGIAEMARAEAGLHD